METRGQLSTKGKQVMGVYEQDEWMTLIVRYLKGQLLEDRKEARKIQVRASRFVIIDDVLYRQGYSHPYLRCANTEEIN